MKAALTDAVQRIKDAGFSYVKVELEGDIGRDGERDCDLCEGSGREDCDNCSNSGYVNFTDDNGNDYENECAECYGDGRTECSDCNGEGVDGGYQSEDWCEDFMREWAERQSAGIGDRLIYGNFYEDGSVDSEFTFTVHIDHLEDVIVWMNAFKAVAEECGSLDVSGAGLHIAILPTESNGRYPTNVSLPQEKVENFQREVTKLLPALFFLGSSGHQSRTLHYRHPKIDWDKYSAINLSPAGYDNSCFEYRLFETCYDKPEAFYDYIQTIANTLRFYADETLKVKELGKKFGFQDRGHSVSRFYDTPEQLRILNQTVKQLKPQDKSFKKLKQERGIGDYTIKTLEKKHASRIEQLTQDYRTYRRRFQEAVARGGSRESLQTLQQFIAENMMPQYSEQVEV